MGIEGDPQKHTKKETPAEKAIREMHRILDAAPDVDRFKPETASIERFQKEIRRRRAEIHEKARHSPDDAKELEDYLENELIPIFERRFGRRPS